MSQNIAVVGLDFRTAAIDIREQLALSGCALEAALQHLSTRRAADSAASVPARETVILSTCNRLEFYLLAEDEAAARRAVAEYLDEARGIPEGRLSGHLYCRTGEQAVEHLLRVASGLESMILGEPQILGQVGQAYEQARAAGASGATLSHLFAAALHCGKRAHCETEIGCHTASLSHAAADLLAAELSGECRVLIVGAGEMAALAAQAVRDHGAREMRFVNRTETGARALAQRFGGEALPWRDLRAGLAWADAVVSATGAPHLVILRADVAAATARRAGRPLLLIDLALPRDIDPAVNDVPLAKRVDLDCLNATLEENRQKRAAAAPAVEAIVAEERAAFMRWLRARAAVPTVVDLRAKAAQVASAELERTLRRLDPADERLARELDCMAHRIINKLLHEPTVRLKAEAEAGNGAHAQDLLRELFDLRAAGDNEDAKRSPGRRGHFVPADGALAQPHAERSTHS